MQNPRAARPRGPSLCALTPRTRVLTMALTLSEPTSMRMQIEQDPFRERTKALGVWAGRGLWPCRWVSCPGAGEPPLVTGYRRRFSVAGAASATVHVSADERYDLFLDGHRIGRGPERGDPDNWFFETYELDLKAGEHVLAARVWSLGDMAPIAQMSLRPGFILCPESEAFVELFGTGVADWEAKVLGGYEFAMTGQWKMVGANVVIDAARFDWGFERGEGEGWQTAFVGAPGAVAGLPAEYPTCHMMRPAMLPAMMEKHRFAGTVRHVQELKRSDAQGVPVRTQDHLKDEAAAWQTLISGDGALTVPPKTQRRVIVDLGDYYTAYPELVTDGGRGACVRVEWAETLFKDAAGRGKGNRDEIEGRYFVGVGDAFLLDGQKRHFETLWWSAGRYLQVTVRTAGEPLTISRLLLRETRYPLEAESGFHCDDERLKGVTPVALRALQMSAHETYVDCPYYEQLLYVGDSRLEALATYALSRDERLPRKALREFDFSRARGGTVMSRFPSRLHQIIPSFSLWWICMVHDYAHWRDDPGFVRSLMPGVRAVIEGLLPHLNADGLLEALRGWNFMDWVAEWPNGVPPEADLGVSGPINWLFALALARAAELEAIAGEPELAARDRRLAEEVAERTGAAFWVQGRKLYADDLGGTRFSEHSQTLAILTGLLSEERMARVGRGLSGAQGLAPASIYFTHYVFEALRRLGRVEGVFARMQEWFDHAAHGMKTTWESGPEGRSDCHGWGAHLLFHYFATLLGIRPASAGFRTVDVAPQLGPLTSVYGRMVHPRGEIEAELVLKDGCLKGFLVLPAAVEGRLRWGAKTLPLEEGRQEVFL
jgi:alpha-L-rhamnosidase